MSLPLPWIEKIFDRLELCYGDAFMRQYSGLRAERLADLKTLWCDELAGYGKAPECIAWALDHLPERPPNVIEFRALCRMAPRKEPERLAAPKADPEKVREVMQQIGQVIKPIDATPSDPKGWARRILDRVNAGSKLPSLHVWMAREALGLNKQQGNTEA